MSDFGQATAKTRELADGVVQVFLPLPFKPTIVNVYLVRAGSTWTLVDTGMHTGDSRRTFEAALAEHGIAPTDVTRIVCTHHPLHHHGTSGPWKGRGSSGGGASDVAAITWKRLSGLMANASIATS